MARRPRKPLALPELFDRLVAQSGGTKSASFLDLVKTAGLDPAGDFVGVSLRDIDLRGEDLRGFDFSQADLTGADFRRAKVKGARFDGAVLTGAIGLPEHAVARASDTDKPPPRYNPSTARRMIQAGQPLPPAWRLTPKEFFFVGTEISELTSLAGLTNLQTLYLHRTLVSDLAPLAGLTRLRVLYLCGAQVNDLAPLAGLASLQGLYLQETQVSDLRPLAGLSSLRTLSLEKTRVSDLTPLAGLTSLRSLDLRGTQLSDFAPVAHVAYVTMPDGCKRDLDKSQRHRPK